MDQQLLQRTRYLLETRFRRVRNTTFGNYANVLSQTMRWLENHPIISSIIERLDEVPGDHHAEIKLLQENMPDDFFYARLVRVGPEENTEIPYKGYTPQTIEEHASACLQVLRASASGDIDLWTTLAVYLTSERYDKFDDILSTFQEIAAKDLHEYIDESLDGIYAVNGFLRKYKQRCEWFQQEELRRIIVDGYGGKTGERALAVHLQQYIFDQSMETIIEPSSASGEADFILRDPNGQITIIDAKYVHSGSTPSVIIRKIAEGFHQVARYCNDYNQQMGFLAVFMNDSASILIDVEQDGPFRYFKIGGYTVYYVEINIAERPSASKAGKAKQVRITADQLIDQLKEISEEANEDQ